MQKVFINPAFDNLDDFIAEIPVTFNETGTTIFIGRNIVKSIIAPDGTELVVKRFGHLNLLRRIAYTTISHSKARRAYDIGLRFIELGFHTPTPVAYIEIYDDGLIVDCYFISLRCEGVQLFDSMVETPAYDAAMADRVAELMAKLHQSGAVHGDPNLKNILYDNKADRLTLIDTNRSFFSTRLSIKRCLRNLMRVTHRRDLIDHISRRYAEIRGLDPDRTSAHIFHLLKNFERSRRIRHKIKSFILRRPVD